MQCTGNDEKLSPNTHKIISKKHKLENKKEHFLAFETELDTNKLLVLKLEFQMS